MNAPMNDVQLVQTGAQPPMEAQAVYGMRIVNPRLATLTRRVLTLSLIIAGLNIITRIVMYVQQNNEYSCASITFLSAIVGIGVSLMVPGCGYF